MATRKQTLKQKLVDYGFLPSETIIMAGGYTITDFRTIPYLQNILKARRLYVASLSKLRGYSDELIKQYIKDRYVLNGWMDGNRIDVWAMIRHYRQKAIDKGEYFPPKRKGSHHGQGVSKGDVKGQRTRSKQKSFLQKYAEKRGRE